MVEWDEGDEPVAGGEPAEECPVAGDEPAEEDPAAAKGIEAGDFMTERVAVEGPAAGEGLRQRGCL